MSVYLMPRPTCSPIFINPYRISTHPMYIYPHPHTIIVAWWPQQMIHTQSSTFRTIPVLIPVPFSLYRMCQLSGPTHRSGGNCSIRIPRGSTTTMRPRRRPSGTGRASATSFRWPSSRLSNRTPIPASVASRPHPRNILPSSSHRSSSSRRSNSNRISPSNSNRRPCPGRTRRDAVSRGSAVAMGRWPAPRRSWLAAKWSLVRGAVRAFGELVLGWVTSSFLFDFLFICSFSLPFVYIPFWGIFCSVGTGDSSRSMDTQQQQHPQAYGSRRSQGECLSSFVSCRDDSSRHRFIHDRLLQSL